MSLKPIFTFKMGNDKNAEYKCNLCTKKGFLTTTIYGLKQHLEKKHSKTDHKNFYESLKKFVSLEPVFTFKEDWQFGKVVYQCNLCPERCSLNSLTTSSFHLEQHLELKHSKNDQNNFDEILKKVSELNDKNMAPTEIFDNTGDDKSNEVLESPNSQREINKSLLLKAKFYGTNKSKFYGTNKSKAVQPTKVDKDGLVTKSKLAQPTPPKVNKEVNVTKSKAVQPTKKDKEDKVTKIKAVEPTKVDKEVKDTKLTKANIANKDKVKSMDDKENNQKIINNSKIESKTEKATKDTKIKKMTCQWAFENGKVSN